jgi:hypothetical protein
MAKKTCSKGHIYDSSIYGDNCPFCPSQGSGTVVCENGGEAGGSGCAGGTEVNQEGRTSIGGVSTNDPTIPLGGGIGGGTVIRPAAGTGNAATPSGKRIVGIIVTYDVLSTGQVHNIFEGRNYIGREVTSDIVFREMVKSQENIFRFYTVRLMGNLNLKMNSPVTEHLLTSSLRTKES